MGKKKYPEDGYDKGKDGKFPDCRYCRYHTSGSKGWLLSAKKVGAGFLPA